MTITRKTGENDQLYGSVTNADIAEVLATKGFELDRRKILLPDPHAADQWVRKPNDAPQFGGRSALERMLSGQVADLYVVREYLDAERG